MENWNFTKNYEFDGNEFLPKTVNVLTANLQAEREKYEFIA